MSAPNPAPYYRPYRQRSIFGPLVLISIGVLFLLRNMGIISGHALGWWFSRYWPVVLILLGVVRLAEYMWARQRGYPAPRIGAGLVVFLVFFIMFGLGATHTAGWNWRGIHDQMGIDDPDFGDFFGWGTNYEFSENFAQPMKPGAQIRVVGSYGDIKITPSDDGQAHVVVQKTIRSDSQDSANNINQNTHPKFDQQGNIWVMDLTNGGFRNGRYNLVMQLPPDSTVSATTRRGDISVTGVQGPVEASSDHGDVTTEQIKGDANLRLRNGTLRVKDVTGNVEVNGEVDDGNVSGVGGSLEFDAGYNGQVQLAKIGKQVHFKSVRTDLQIPKLDGEATLGDGNLRVRSASGPLRLETRSNDIHLEDVTGEVHVQNRNGVVELTGKPPLGSIDITNVHGGIELTLPASAGFQLNATSNSGNIDSEFPGVSVDNSHNDSTARGTVGKGGPDVRLRADHGTIQIRKE